MCSDSAVIVRWIVRWTYGIAVQKVDVAQWVDELAVLYTATPQEEHKDRAPHSFIPGQKSAWGPSPALSGVFQPEIVVHGMAEFLLAAEIPLGCLNRCVAKEKLNLLKFSASEMA